MRQGRVVVFRCMGDMQVGDAGAQAQRFRSIGLLQLRLFTPTWRGKVHLGAGFPDAQRLLPGSDPGPGQ